MLYKWWFKLVVEGVSVQRELRPRESVLSEVMGL